MDIVKTMRVPPGRYVVAVSGGVDSMVLLDLLRKMPHIELTVAHFDHGIRVDSKSDRLFVQETAKKHGLPFAYGEGNLGEGVSENVARKARYEFLESIKKSTNAEAIITAHHLDDLVETAVHNVLRGTGRKGMSSLKSVDGMLRPLLHLPKVHLRGYADHHQLAWHEDSTNANLTYRRNYIRNVLLPKLKSASPDAHEKLKQLVRRQAELNRAIDISIGTILHVQPDTTTLRRSDIVMLPHMVARETVAEWLRQNGKREFSRGVVERLTIAVKTARPKTVFELDKNKKISFDKQHAHMLNM